MKPKHNPFANVPVYTLDTMKGTLTYKYAKDYRKWMFQLGNDCLLLPCKGNANAHKIGNIIVGSIKRSGKIDGLARSIIDKICRA